MTKRVAWIRSDGQTFGNVCEHIAQEGVSNPGYYLTKTDKTGGRVESLGRGLQRLTADTRRRTSIGFVLWYSLGISLVLHYPTMQYHRLYVRQVELSQMKRLRHR